MALTSDDDAEIAAFLDRKRQWLFNTRRELEAKTSKRAVVPRFMTGSKIPYRGRMARLTVHRHDGGESDGKLSDSLRRPSYSADSLF